MTLPRFCAVLTLVFVAAVARAAVPVVAERVEAASLLALGRPANAAERAAGTGREQRPLAELLAEQRERLQGDAAERRAAFVRAWRDVHGDAPAAAEVESAPARLHAEHLAVLTARLAARPAEYRQVVTRAYRTVLARAPFAEEYEYWGGRPTLSYVLLVGCVENWARRNAPGLMATTGTPTIGADSERLAAYRLAPALAAEAAQALGRPLSELAWARGCTVIVPGAEGIVSVGGVPLLVIGAEPR